MERRHSLIKLRVPVLDWQLHFPGVNESPRARHATVVSVSPSKPVAPFLRQDDENDFHLRSRSFAPCDVHETVRLGYSVARALLETILIILKSGSYPIAPSLVAALPETFLNILKDSQLGRSRLLRPC